jgi:hypothetical protein
MHYFSPSNMQNVINSLFSFITIYYHPKALIIIGKLNLSERSFSFFIHNYSKLGHVKDRNRMKMKRESIHISLIKQIKLNLNATFVNN